MPSRAAIQAELQRRARNKLRTFFPETGPHARILYPKHLQFFRGGLDHTERLFMAANRVGKTIAGAYETTLHLTGRYPAWWDGKRFPHAIDAWAAGDTGDTTRDIIQLELLGKPGEFGTGMIPADSIKWLSAKRSNRKPLHLVNSEDIEAIYVRHISGGVSILRLKSYDQGRRTFQGTGKHLIWLDEEPPLDVYTECYMRTMTTGGLILITFTPLNGISEVIKQFLPELAEDDESAVGVMI